MRKSIVKLFVVFALIVSVITEISLLPSKEIGAAQSKVVISNKKLKKAKLNIDLVVEGKTLKYKGFKVNAKVDNTKKTVYYVPAKVFAKAVGAKCKIKGKNGKIVMGNWAISFKVGSDGYSAAPSDGSISYAKIANLGKAYKKDGVVYIPAEVFLGLYMDLMGKDITFLCENSALKFYTTNLLHED